MDYLLGRLLDPLLLAFHPGERLYWLYLASALAIALVLFVFRLPKESLSLQAVMRFCLPKKILLHRSALVDYKFFVVNRVVFGILMLPAAPAAALAAAAGTSAALLATLGAPAAPLVPGAGWLLLQTLASALAMDFGLFLAHRLQHTVPLLWEFHKVHHSAEVLTPVTAYRVHPVDDLLSMGLSGALGGLVVGAFQYAQPGNAGPAVLLGLHAAVFVYYLAGFNLRHSHVWLSYGPSLSRFLISPAQHQIHHSAAERHFGKNLGFIFAFWDGLFGTLYVPRQLERLEFGLSEGESARYRGVRRLYFLPFANALRGSVRPAAIVALGVVLLAVCAQSIGVLAVAMGK